MTTKSNFAHPLIARPMSRRSLLVGAPAVALALRGMNVGAQTPQATGDSEAVALLKESTAAVNALKTFSFDLETVSGESSIMQGFGLKAVKGVVRRPMDLHATAQVSSMLGDVSVEAIALEGTLWIQNPLDGLWMELGSADGVGSLLNPDSIIKAAVQVLEDAKITGDEKLDGQQTTTVEGTLRLKQRLSSIGAGSELERLLADSEVATVFWINEQKRPIRIEFEGKIFADDSDDVIRRISLGKFDEPVEIKKPALGTPTN